MQEATYSTATSIKAKMAAINAFLDIIQDEGGYPADVSLPDLETIAKELSTLKTFEAGTPDPDISEAISSAPVAFRDTLKNALEARVASLQTEFDNLQDPE